MKKKTVVLLSLAAAIALCTAWIASSGTDEPLPSERTVRTSAEARAEQEKPSDFSERSPAPSASVANEASGVEPAAVSGQATAPSGQATGYFAAEYSAAAVGQLRRTARRPFPRGDRHQDAGRDRQARLRHGRRLRLAHQRLAERIRQGALHHSPRRTDDGIRPLGALHRADRSLRPRAAIRPQNVRPRLRPARNPLSGQARRAHRAVGQPRVVGRTAPASGSARRSGAETAERTGARIPESARHDPARRQEALLRIRRYGPGHSPAHRTAEPSRRPDGLGRIRAARYGPPARHGKRILRRRGRGEKERHEQPDGHLRGRSVERRGTLLLDDGRPDRLRAGPLLVRRRALPRAARATECTAFAPCPTIRCRSTARTLAGACSHSRRDARTE